MPDRTYMNSKLGKAYTQAEDDIKGVTLPAEGTSVLVMAEDIPVNYSFDDLKSRGYTVSEPFVVNAAEGQWGYTIGYPKKYRASKVNTGIAERRAIDKLLKEKGFDPQAFGELIKFEENKLKAGQKTNWNPGRLPNGARIAADGTYIPADVVREDVKKSRMKK